MHVQTTKIPKPKKMPLPTSKIETIIELDEIDNTFVKEEENRKVDQIQQLIKDIDCQLDNAITRTEKHNM